MKNINMRIVYLFTILVFILSGCTTELIGENKDYEFDSNQDISFYIATDIHYLSDNINDHGEAFEKYISSGDGKQLQYIGEILDSFIYDVKKTKPNILIISGDLTNNGEKESHLELAKKLKDIERNGTLVYVIPGNHDVLNPWARGFSEDRQYVTDNITQEEFSDIYSDFGYDEAVLRDESTLSYLITPAENLWLLMLDTNKYKENSKWNIPRGDGEITQDTLGWIKKCMAMANEKGATLIPVMHHNAINHSEMLNKGYTIDNYKEVANLFIDNDINIVLSGHIHVQDISSYSKDGNKLYDIATNSLAVYPHQFGVLRFSPKSNSLEYSTSKVDVENWSKSEKILDNNLNNFEKYSADYFGSFAYDMAFKNLMQYDNLSKDEIESMSETMKILNLKFFAGTENLNSEEITESHSYKLWSDVSNSFITRYIMSISSDDDSDDNYLKLYIDDKE